MSERKAVQRRPRLRPGEPIMAKDVEMVLRCQGCGAEWTVTMADDKRDHCPNGCYIGHKTGGMLPTMNESAFKRADAQHRRVQYRRKELGR